MGVGVCVSEMEWNISTKLHMSLSIVGVIFFLHLETLFKSQLVALLRACNNLVVRVAYFRCSTIVLLCDQ